MFNFQNVSQISSTSTTKPQDKTVVMVRKGDDSQVQGSGETPPQIHRHISQTAQSSDSKSTLYLLNILRPNKNIYGSYYIQIIIVFYVELWTVR